MRHLLIAALLAIGGSAHAAGLGCQNTTGGLVLEKIRADAVGTQPFGCINRSIDILSAVAVDTNTFAALSKSTAALSVSTESLRVSVNLKANLAGATFTGASGITNQSFTATGPNGLIISGSSVNASAFFGNGAGLTNIPNTSPCAVGAGSNSMLCQGVSNQATGIRATTSGGASNIAGGDNSVVAGGASNSTGAGYAVVSGGFNNVANGSYGTILGGSDGIASASYSTVIGGILNSASDTYTLAAGRRAKAAHSGAFVWADSTNADYTSAAINSFNVRATGGAFFSAHVSAANSSVTASGFFGNGSALTGVLDTTKVAKTGDTMTGNLNMTNTPINLTGASGNIVGQASVTASGFFGSGAVITYVQASSITVSGIPMTVSGSIMSVGGNIDTTGDLTARHTNYPVVSAVTTDATYAAMATQNSGGRWMTMTRSDLVGAGDFTIQNVTDGTFPFYITKSNGKAMFGTYGSPAGRLDARSIDAAGAYVLAVSSQNASVMAGVKGDGSSYFGGNVGIGGLGASHPATKLHMSSGTLLLDGTGNKLKLSGASGVASANSGFLDLTNAGYGSVGTENWVGAVSAGIVGYNATSTHRFYTGVAGTGVMDIASTGATVTGTAVITSSTQVNGTLSVGEGTTADTMSAGSRMRIYDQTKPGLQIDGFSNTGASVLGGEIRLGSSGAYHGKLSFDGANAHMNIVNTYDNGDSRVQLVSRHTRVNASTATFTNGVLSITAPAATQAGFQPPVRTKAQIDAITPVDLGTIIICQNCSAPYSICVATGATLSGYRRSDSTTIGCGTNN